MKKTILLIIIGLIFQFVNSQTQPEGKWVLPTTVNGGPNDVLLLIFDGTTISYQDLTIQEPNGYYYIAGGAFDSQYNLDFYILDNRICWNDQYYEWVNNDSEFRPDHKIISKPGDPTRYFHIFSGELVQQGEANPLTLYCDEFYFNNGTPERIENDLISGIQTQNSYLGIALTEEQQSARKLYAALGQHHVTEDWGLYRWNLDASGAGSKTLMIDANASIGNADFYAYDLELKETANGTTLAWNTYYASSKSKVFIYWDETPDDYAVYDLTQSYAGAGRIGGVEFSGMDDNTLYISCENVGIVELNINTGNTSVLHANDYSRTYLQTAPDGHIYGVSNDGCYLGQISMDDGTFTSNFFSIPNYGEVGTYNEFDNQKFYILPDNDRTYIHLTATYDSTYITCPGDADGSATVFPSGGCGNYSYAWYVQTPAGGWKIMSGYNGATASNLGEGVYKCIITDDCGETFEVVVVITTDPNLFDVNNFDTIVDVGQPITLTNWDQSFKKGFRVLKGADVTFENSLIEFGKDAKLIIEQGAIVRLENTILTYFEQCPDMWQGVEVWGTSTKSQYETDLNGDLYQGKLVLNDSSAIMHAKVAAAAWKPGDPSSTGGIIQGTDSYFTNNAKSVHILAYKNYLPTNPFVETDNICWFNRCVFDIDNNYMGVPLFYKHVDLDRVRGVRLMSCDFSVSDVQGVHDWNYAIAAYSAGFSVRANCLTGLPCTQYDRSNFEGFHRAIYAADAVQGPHYVSISRADFTGNEIGVYFSEMRNSTVFLCDFEIEYKGVNNHIEAFGIDLLGCSGFAIEENNFTKLQGAPTASYVGIRAADCPSEHDIIYKNNLDGLSYGNYAEGTNRADENDDAHGVEYRCNTNNNNEVDFIVVDSLNFEQAMIRTDQGYPGLASGNTFSPLAAWHFRNEGIEQIDWYYCDVCPDETPDPNKIYTYQGGPYFDAETTDENPCLSHYGGGTGGTEGRTLLTEEEMAEREQTYAQSTVEYNNVKNLYDNLADGGNTQELKTEVEHSQPPDMWQLRTELLGKSPHLSQEVLMAAAAKTDVLPESVIFEILSANPDELKEAELIQYLENKEDPLPQYMIDILEQLSYGVTYKTTLKREMAKHHATKTQAALDIVRSLLSDTVVDLNEYRNWLDNIGGLNADKQIIASFISEENYTDAQTMLNLLPSFYNLEGETLAEYNDYKTLTEMQIGWNQQSKSIFELDSLELVALEDFAENSTGCARNISRGMLTYAYGYKFYDGLSYSDPSYMKSDAAVAGETGEHNNQAWINANPNPATDWVVFDYSLNERSKKGIIEIKDVTGSMVETISVDGAIGQEVWDTRNIKPGIYFYIFKSNAFSKSGKIIINK